MADYLELDGEKVSRKEYCKRKGFNYYTVRDRMKLHNETFEQAIQYYEENGIKTYLAYLVECNGEKVSRNEYCKRRGLCYNTVKQRMKLHNETFKQATKYYEENGTEQRLIDYNGEKISQRKYCEKKGLNYNTLRHRMQKYNETFEQAVSYYEENGVKLQRQRGIIKDRRFYNVWQGMVDRCTNPKNQAFEKYSKLGIQESWLKFENFQDDMYEEYLKCPCSPNDLPSIDRKNNDIGYFKDNCHWIPKSKQNRNKNNNIWANEDELLIDYCERKCLRYDIMLDRLHSGYTLEEAEAMPMPKYTGKYLDYIGKSIREFTVLTLSDICPSVAIAECKICKTKTSFDINSLINNTPNKGCSCRRGHKYYIGNNNYTLKELDTIYNYTHKQIKEAIANNDMSLFSDIVDLSYDEWIELLKDIHNKW